MKTNSAAVKRYWETLSPNKKAQILIRHVAEQQNYQQSLSPEKKTQILCNDAEGHRKQRKDLPPEKKIKILQTNADAHNKKRESLSPEDKELFDKKNHSAAQNKHCKSLTLDQKAQELQKIAANQKIPQTRFLGYNIGISCIPSQNAKISEMSEVWKHVVFHMGMKIRVSTWSFLSVVHPLQIPIPMYEKTTSFLLCMDLQPYSHDCFSKILRPSTALQ